MLEKEKIVELYRKYNRELFVYIYRFMRSRENAEDILHDCFVNLIRYSEKKEIDETSIKAFLYKIAHNLSINQIKRAKKISFSNIDDGPDISADEDHSKKLELDDLNKKINSLLLNVDELSRSMFLMKKELGLTMLEIAENTGKSERTVRRRIEDVLSYLALELKKEDFE